MPGTGTGTLGTPVGYQALSSYGLVVADFGRNGTPDVALLAGTKVGVCLGR